MDLGVRGRARWATMLGIVAALALIGASLVALNRSVLSFDGWSTEPQQGVVEQTLPPEPETAIDTGTIGGAAVLPGTGISGATGTPLAPVLPIAGGGAGGVGGGGGGATGGTTGGTPGGTTTGGTGGTG